MRRVITTLAALALAGGATATLVAPASAADGVFLYASPGGTQRLEDPANDRPLQVDGLFFAHNGTDTRVGLYQDPGCRTAPFAVVDSDDEVHGLPPFRCVKFFPYDE